MKKFAAILSTVMLVMSVSTSALAVSPTTQSSDSTQSLEVKKRWVSIWVKISEDSYSPDEVPYDDGHGYSGYLKKQPIPKRNCDGSNLIEVCEHNYQGYIYYQY
jgi:hypothetical protein